MHEAARFEGLVLKYLNSLYSYALTLARHPQDAQDLLGECLARGYERFASYDRSLGFKPWIFAIMRHAHIDRARQRQVRPAEESLALDEDVEPVVVTDSPLHSIPLAPEDILLRRETVEQVREAIRRLPPTLREVVELRDIEGLSYQEIARVIDRPVGTVMSRLYRGRNLLRTYLLEPPAHCQSPPGVRLHDGL